MQYRSRGDGGQIELSRVAGRERKLRVLVFAELPPELQLCAKCVALRAARRVQRSARLGSAENDEGDSGKRHGALIKPVLAVAVEMPVRSDQNFVLRYEMSTSCAVA